MIGENPHDSLTPTSKRRRRPASLGTGMQPPIGHPTPQRRLATHHNFAACSHLDGQRVTKGHKMALLYIFCNLLPVRHPWHRYHGCGGGRSSPPEPTPLPPTPAGKPPPSLVRHLPLVCGLTTPVPCCHTFCCGMDGGWDSHANAPNSEGRSNAEVPFSSPQCHPLGKAFRGSENCLDLTLPTNVRYSLLVHTDLVSNAKQQVGRQPRHRQRSLDTV